MNILAVNCSIFGLIVYWIAIWTLQSLPVFLRDLQTDREALGFIAENSRLRLLEKGVCPSLPPYRIYVYHTLCIIVYAICIPYNLYTFLYTLQPRHPCPLSLVLDPNAVVRDGAGLGLGYSSQEALAPTLLPT